jgi:hypothetical protein
MGWREMGTDSPTISDDDDHKIEWQDIYNKEFLRPEKKNSKYNKYSGWIKYFCCFC